MSRRSLYWLLGLVLAGGLLGLLRFDAFQVGTFFDDAHYIVLAESLATGQGYRLINFPIPVAEFAFPPGWPLLLTPLTVLFPGQYEVFKAVSFVLSLASIPLLYALFSKRLDSPCWEALLALTVLNPLMIGISGMVMSEAAFVFFSLLTFYLFDLWEGRSRTPNRKGYWLLLIAFTFAAVFTQLIRTVGIALLFALIVNLLLSRRMRAAFAVACLMLLGMLPQIWLNTQSGGAVISSGYQAQVFSVSATEKVSQILSNLQSYTGGMVSSKLVPYFGQNVAAMFNAWGLGSVLTVANILILLVVFIGAVVAFFRFRLSVLYTVFYFGALLNFWNPVVGNTQDRFLVPILPFLYSFLIYGILWLVYRTAQQKTGLQRRSAVAIVGITIVILLASLVHNYREWRNPIRNSITDLSLGATWIAENAASDAIVMTEAPVPHYLYMHRKTVAYPDAGENIDAYLRDQNIDYVLVSPPLRIFTDYNLSDYAVQDLVPALTASPAAFELVYSDPPHNVSIYAVRGGS